MAEAPEVTTARNAAKVAMDHWTSVQGQTNDQKTIAAAKQAFMDASVKVTAAQQAAKTQPAAGYGR
jgi:hypothetical protein